MNSKFHIFQLILVCLLTIFIVGCSRDDPTPMEELAGKYTLVTLETSENGFSVSLEPPAVFGDMSLGSGGGNWSLTWVFAHDGTKVNDTGTWWSASATTLRLSPRWPEPYTWDGTYLTLTLTEKLTVKFQKL